MARAFGIRYADRVTTVRMASVLRTIVRVAAAAVLLFGVSVAPATSFYASPAGTTSTAPGTGTITNPWALTTALAQPAAGVPLWQWLWILPCAAIVVLLFVAAARDRFRARLPADPLGRGIRRGELRVGLLERLQLLQEPVEVRVRDGRVVEHVIPVLVMPDLIPQFFDFLNGVFAGRHGRILTAGGLGTTRKSQV